MPIMSKRVKKLYRVNVYNNILLHGFGWYQTNVRIYAKSIRECIENVNKLFPFESSLVIYNITDDKVYCVSENRKTYARY